MKTIIIILSLFISLNVLAHGGGGFGLSERLVEFDAGKFIPAFKHVGVERFACVGAIFER